MCADRRFTSGTSDHSNGFSLTKWFQWLMIGLLLNCPFLAKPKLSYHMPSYFLKLNWVDGRFCWYCLILAHNYIVASAIPRYIWAPFDYSWFVCVQLLRRTCSAVDHRESTELSFYADVLLAEQPNSPSASAWWNTACTELLPAHRSERNCSV